MVHVFKGQVKVADVQNEFTYLINMINELVDKYNAALSSLNYSVDKGAAVLAPEGYSLSIGGLKSIIESYDGYTIGCHVLKGNGKYVITSGVIFRDNSAIKLPQALITADATKTYLNFNTTNNTYSLSNTKTDSETLFTVRAINPQRNQNILDSENVTAINSKLKVFCDSHGEPSIGTKETIDTNKENFITYLMGEIGRPQDIFFLGTKLSSAWRTTSHNAKVLFNCLNFYKPKGIPNPFSFLNETKWQDIILNFNVIKRT